MAKITTLAGGVTVVTELVPHVLSAAIGIWVRAGARDEAPTARWTADKVAAERGQENGAAIPGITHFIEHMMFKGTEKRTALAIAEDIDRTGGMINAFTGQEATCYYVKTLSTHIPTAIDVLSDMLTGSVFDAGEMEKEKGVVIEEINMIEDNPEDIGQDLIMESIFDGTCLGNRVIGTKESVTSIGRQDILAYIDQRYRAGNMVISVAGNFEEDILMDALEAAFGSIPAGGAPRTGGLNEHRPLWISKKKDVEQSHLYLGQRGEAMASEHYFPFILYSSILGGGMSSRLFQNVREDKGLAYSVYSTSASYVDGGAFYIYAGVGQNKEAEALEAIRIETERLAEEDVTEDELQKVKEQCKGQYLFSLESVQSRMFSLGRNVLHLGREVTQEEVVAGVDAVTVAHLGQQARRFAALDSYSAVMVGGREVSRKDLFPCG